MTLARPALERRIATALAADPPRVPVLVGSSASGRTSVLQRLSGRLPLPTRYLDIERTATTPERLLRRVLDGSAFDAPDVPSHAATPRGAFDAFLAYLRGARGPSGGPVTFLLDEVLEFRTFENFPGLRDVVRLLVEASSATDNRFVFTSRYVSRAMRLLGEAPRIEMIPMPPLAADEVRDVVLAAGPAPGTDVDDAARAIHALTDGHAGYAFAVARETVALSREGGGDPVSALAALLEPRGALAREGAHCYEMRLHRARGYGALKGILDILADEEPLTLTAIAQRLQRTPGSTRDYLSWLEDVDLVTVRRKRYSFTDPLLRLWTRLHSRPAPPSPDEVVRLVHEHALARLPAPEPVLAAVAAGADHRKGWGIIEID